MCVCACVCMCVRVCASVCRTISNHYIIPGNEISHVDGLRGLEHLTELVLDRNKIKVDDSGGNTVYVCNDYSGHFRM